MKRKLVWVAVSCLMVLSLVMASCGPAEEEAEVEVGEEEVEVGEVEVSEEEGVGEEEEVSPEGPQYGGTFIHRVGSDPNIWEGWFGMGTDGWGMHATLTYENIATGDWVNVPMDTWDFRQIYYPASYAMGLLVESWETEDLQTLTFHVRKGVHFHNKPPTNGREMTAEDVKLTWDRLLGVGSGYTTPSPYASIPGYGPVESITVTDKYTVVVKTANASIGYLTQFLQVSDAYITPKDAVEEYGDLNFWTRSIGTGPFVIQDYIPGASMTYDRNPNYWGIDERYPALENQLPYVDHVKVLIIPDLTTAISALRTGKVDRLTGVAADRGLTVSETNPELAAYTTTMGMPGGIAIKVTSPPFDNIKVRKAMQMSLDLETIAKTHYGGIPDGKPCAGVISYPGFSSPYEDWPQDVKDGFAYNPEGARQLLTEAGYPNGFSCTVVAPSYADMDLLQIMKAYFSDINIDMEIQAMDAAAARAYAFAGNADLTSGVIAFRLPSAPTTSILTYTTSHGWEVIHQINDPHYEDLVAAAVAAMDEDEQMRLCRQCDMYSISQFWAITVQPTYSTAFYQPWIKDIVLAKDFTNVARLWIDQDMKKSLGH